MAAPKRRIPGPKLEVLEDRSVPAVIGGIVYNDANYNGTYQVGETPLAGVTLTLTDEAGNVVSTTTSGADGRYEFTQRDNASTQPAVVSYDAVFDSAATDLDRNALVSKFDPALGTLLSVDIIAEGSITSHSTIENLGSKASEVKAGYKGTLSYQVQGLGQSISASIDKEYRDTAGAFDGTADLKGSSTKDFGEIKMDGQYTTVTITDASQLAAFQGTGSMTVAQQASANACSCGPGNLMSMVNTTAQGKVRVVYRYTPSNEIGPGKYTITETQPANYLDGRETKDNSTVISGSDKTDTIVVGVVNRNDSLKDNNFGELIGASVSGQVYHDVDKSGSLNAGDQPISGTLVYLEGGDVFGNIIRRTTVTDASGAYSFTGLLPGGYVVTESQPSGFSQGTNTIGSHGGTVNGDSFVVTLNNGDAGTHYDFGEIKDTSTPPPPSTDRPPSDPSRDQYFGKFMFTGLINGL